MPVCGTASLQGSQKLWKVLERARHTRVGVDRKLFWPVSGRSDHWRQRASEGGLSVCVMELVWHQHAYWGSVVVTLHCIFVHYFKRIFLVWK